MTERKKSYEVLPDGRIVLSSSQRLALDELLKGLSRFFAFSGAAGFHEAHATVFAPYLKGFLSRERQAEKFEVSEAMEVLHSLHDCAVLLPKLEGFYGKFE